MVLTHALSEHESGAPVAVIIASKQPKSETSKTEGEDGGRTRLRVAATAQQGEQAEAA